MFYFIFNLFSVWYKKHSTTENEWLMCKLNENANSWVKPPNINPNPPANAQANNNAPCI